MPEVSRDCDCAMEVIKGASHVTCDIKYLVLQALWVDNLLYKEYMLFLHTKFIEIRQLCIIWGSIFLVDYELCVSFVCISYSDIEYENFYAERSGIVYWHGSTETLPWVNNCIDCFPWDAIIRPKPYLDGSIAKLLLKLAHEWIITSYIKQTIDTRTYAMNPMLV